MDNSIKVLIVDDNPHLLGFASRLLRQAGYEVLEAATGADGLHLARERKPDLILLDVVLPDMNGLEVCRIIKAEPALAGTLVILISGLRTTTDSQVMGLESGADGYIGRPVANRELLARVQAMARVKRLQDELQGRTDELRGRVKELECLYRIGAVVEEPNITLEEILQRIVELMPSAWQYPEITVVRLVLEDQAFVTAGFQETSWSLGCDVVANDEPLGHLQVCYVEERPERDEGPFSREEGDLLEAIAQRLGRIIERHQSQAALEESEQKYRDLVENINEVIYTLDLDGILTYVSPGVESLLGLPPLEAIGRHFREFIQTEDLASASEGFQAILSGKNAANEYRVVTKSGAVRWIRTSSRPVIRQGQVTGAQGMLADVTDRHEAQDHLRRLSEAVEQSPSMVVITDLQGNIEYVNRRFCETTGYTPQEAIGQNPRLLKSGQHREAYYRELWDTILAGQQWRGELVNKDKSGEIYCELASISPITNAQGDTTHFVKVAEDITERRKIEEALRQSEGRLRHAHRLAQLGHWDWSLQTNELHWSSEVFRIFGQDPERFQPTVESFEATIHPDDLEAFIAEREQALAEERDVSIEHRVVWPDGTIHHVHESAEIIRDDQDRVVSVLGTVQDLTERKRAEEALEKSEAWNRAILNALPDLMFVLSRDGTFLDYRAADTDVLYVPPEQFLGRNVRDVFPEQFASTILDLIEQAIATGETQTHEYLLTIAGQRRWFEARMVPYGEDQVLTIIRETTEHRQAEDALRESEARSRAQYEGMPIPIYTWQRSGDDAVLIDYNRAAMLMTQDGIRDFMGMKASEMYEDRPDIVEDLSRCLTEKHSFEREMTYGFKTTGEDKHLMVRYAYVPPDLVLVHTEDITERKRTEERIQTSLQEKEVLLKEIHHRVKNNLQVVSSLLDMQALSVQRPEVIEALEDSRHRIRAMAFVHERLYQSEDLSSIGVAEYIRSLVGHLSAAYEGRARGAELHLQIDSVFLDLDTAIACGLLINELVSNALKHAFPVGWEGVGEIHVALQSLSDGYLELRVSDNGVGLPPGLAPAETTSLGLRLVQMLTQQLRGRLEVDGQGGTAVRITFADPGWSI